MAHEFLLPDIGEGLVDAEVVSWLVALGDRVEADQPVVEVETAKAVVEIPSPYSGVVLHLGAGEGETVDVGEVLIVIGEEGEEWEPSAERRATSDEREAGEPRKADTVPPSQPAPPQAPGAAAGTSVKAVPLVRRLAKEHGVDLVTLSGSGHGGSITREDVMAAVEGATPAGGVDERVRLSRTRRTISEHMVRSWSEIPHVTVFADVDASRMLDARRAIAVRESRVITLDVLLVKAVIPALQAHPEFNASLDGEDLILKRHYDIGVAVDTAQGLIVPVARGADTASLGELADLLNDLFTRTRERRLEPPETSGATFTVSNIGALGGRHGTPIIPYGTTAILSVGRARDSATVRDGELVIAPLMPLSLSYDHRVIDGGMGQRFLADLIADFEDPDRFL